MSDNMHIDVEVVLYFPAIKFLKTSIEVLSILQDILEEFFKNFQGGEIDHC